MNDQQDRLVVGPPADVDDEDDDVVPGSDDLPETIHEDDIAAHEPPGDDAAAPDTDLDAAVEGEPDEGEIPEA
jgi:hypothetical protein